MELKTLVQKRDKLNADKVIKFVSKIPDAKLVVFHCSINDDTILERFAREMKDKLSVPFVGVRVSASLTNDGFHEDSIAAGVFSGDFTVKVYHDKLDFENPGETIENIASKLPEKGLCLIYAACYYTEGARLDHVLRNVNSRKQRLQFCGSLSSPQPFVFSNDGVFRKDVVYCIIDNVDYDFKLLSGLDFRDDSEKHVVTKASEYAIYEIDNTNAVKLYCGIKHVRPYFVNMILKTVAIPDAHKIFKLLSAANESMYKAILRANMYVMASVTAHELIEPAYLLHLDEDKSEWISQSYKAVQTEMRWLDNDAIKQIAVYDKISKDFGGSKFIFGHECCMRLFYMNFHIRDIETKASKFRAPLMLSYGYGEFGAYLPYTDTNINVMHGGIVQVLGFK